MGSIRFKTSVFFVETLEGGADGTVRLFRREQALMMKDLAHVRLAESGPDISAAQILLWNYATTLPSNQCLSDLRDLPGPYRAPSGALLVAWQSGIPSGCVAIRPLEGAGQCELKRLYVDPAARRAGLGRMLVKAAMDHASRLGYVELVLDTMPSMLAAVALYQQLGFAPVAPYYLSSSPDMLFFSTKL